jgi:NADPH:quinone reductase-like Zn-dependent oxidoreductase
MGGNEVWILSYFAAALTLSLARGGTHLGLMPGWQPFHPDDVAILRQLITEAAIEPRIDRRYPLAEIVAALRDVHEGRSKGKIVITM